MRTLKLLVLAVFSSYLLWYGSALAENLFIDCYIALSHKEFSNLKKFYEKHTDIITPTMCLRLNNTEFLVLVGVTKFYDGLYHVDTRRGTAKLQEGKYPMPFIRVEREFTGKSGKRYVLLTWEILQTGIYGGGYAIVNLVPRKDGKPFIFYDLLFFGETYDGLCGNFLEANKEEWPRITDGTAEHVNSYRILSEGTGDVAIVFEMTEQDCKTLEKKNITRTYKLSNGVFTLVKPTQGGSQK